MATFPLFWKIEDWTMVNRLDAPRRAGGRREYKKKLAGYTINIDTASEPCPKG
ncbi:MAG: hypothetical protein OP8BY_2157 [Candidatus Saccharicenans subterraneus]|uniref:Uncharacterized protein n=1 Tax=Candidatus Saccharicenans subterraneus TaxID=2508984 RepID=A0A3E2BLX7_9BACT|nr:MAG: hypothetical protein OP8BY_2157 [Candidatus Saccharicenans subterraneum]